MPAQVPDLNLTCCTDPNIVAGLVRNAVRRHTVSFDQNCSQVLGCNMTPDVLTEVNRLVGALGTGFDTSIQTIASALPTVGIDRILTAAQGAVSGVITQLNNEVNSIVNDITSQITSGTGGILSYTASQLAELNQEIAEAQQAVNQTINDVVGSVNRELNTIANTIASSITNTVNDILPRAELDQLNRSISQVIRCPV